MISNPSLWKSDLLDVASSLKSRYAQNAWNDEAEFALEKEIFIGFYIVRKLIENGQVSKVVSNHNLEHFQYPKLNEDYIDSPNQFPKSFDLIHGATFETNYRQLANQFIHSHHFSAFVPYESTLMGFYFASDRERKNRIFYLRLIEVIQVYESVAKDSIVSLELIDNGDTTFSVSTTEQQSEQVGDGDAEEAF